METETQDLVDERAAFESAVSGDMPVEKQAEADPVIEAVQEVVKDEEAAPSVPTLTPEEIAAFRESASKVTEFQGELRKVHGRIGALNDQLHQKLEAKKAEGEPAVLTAPEMKRMKEQFPELAGEMGADIAEAMASMRSLTPEAIQKISDERYEARRQDERMAEVLEEHPDFIEVINTADFARWTGTLTESEKARVNTSKAPAFVSKTISTFKAWHAGEAEKQRLSDESKQKSQARLKAAIPPTGSHRPNQQTLSAREAEERAFADAANS